mmetsp:Transcript_9286/g.34347  ORF Transcript_9286/g.34347 Transcript_9286/m.34347 type:complete len:100 (+) Transcript_9286:219-518(+)
MMEMTLRNGREFAVIGGGGGGGGGAGRTCQLIIILPASGTPQSESVMPLKETPCTRPQNHLGGFTKPETPSLLFLVGLLVNQFVPFSLCPRIDLQGMQS